MTATPSCALLGTGHSLGDAQVTSAAIDAEHGYAPGHTQAKSGVRTRRWCENSDQIEMGATAARAALSDANVAATDLDAIISASAVPYQTIPATAPLFQRALGVADGAVTAMDVNATCLGFLGALQLATGMIEAGRWARVMIVCSERASRGLDWTSPTTAGLFGDGAGAAVIGAATGDGHIGTVSLKTYPSAYDASSLAAGGTRFDHNADPAAFEANRRFAMDGRALFRLTRKHFGAFVDDVLAREGWTMKDVDLVVPHQASPRALKQMARALGVGDRIVDVAADQGNMIAASLPVTLDHARRTGRAGPGARVLMLGTAAGVTFGAGCLTL